jgi:hypothetical protein
VSLDTCVSMSLSMLLSMPSSSCAMVVASSLGHTVLPVEDAVAAPFLQVDAMAERLASLGVEGGAVGPWRLSDVICLLHALRLLQALPLG